MRAALALARRGLGTTWPNPAVGCVITDSAGRVAGRGWTQPGGRPHAETEALQRAGERAAGGTAYVTLEPCSHHGQTPPCADALIQAKLRRVVVACTDPDPRVSGNGIRMLERAGLPVTVGVCEAQARELNAGFFNRILHKRPLVTLKFATTLDGRIATHRGESRWITGPHARQLGHLLRADHDGIMVGVGTAATDNPELTCRLPGLDHRSPVRIVLDGRLRLPLTVKLVSDAKRVPTWLIALPGADGGRRQAYADCGVEIIEVDTDDAGHPSLADALAALAERGLTRVLVEGGSRITAALLRVGLVDRIVWFRAPSLIGGDGIPATQAFGVDHIADLSRFTRVGVFEAGDDLVEMYHRCD
jgi:diaminohydroxyphosphoribosylaminopyrimidine deaminase/5-amino-6-(5-phosphoribosylamino)uracil reductase